MQAGHGLSGSSHRAEAHHGVLVGGPGRHALGPVDGSVGLQLLSDLGLGLLRLRGGGQTGEGLLDKGFQLFAHPVPSPF